MLTSVLRTTALALILSGHSQAGAAAGTPSMRETLIVPAGWTLSWNDEFDVDGLPDPRNWGHDTHHNRHGWPNGEAQYYSATVATNAVVFGGRLLITARRESASSATDWGGQEYTSARLLTRGLAEWTYGFFEIRAKLPCGRGTWPAIWLLGTQGDWPANGEIDIMEQAGAAPGRILSTIHTPAGSGSHGVGAIASLPDSCTAFHRYQMMWTSREIRIGIDGFEHLVYPRLDVDDASAKRLWPFDSPQFLLLNVAVGGNLGGAIDDDVFPATLEVDYVRVWQPRTTRAAKEVTAREPSAVDAAAQSPGAATHSNSTAAGESP